MLIPDTIQLAADTGRVIVANPVDDHAPLFLEVTQAPTFGLPEGEASSASPASCEDTARRRCVHRWYARLVREDRSLERKRPRQLTLVTDKGQKS